MTGTLSVTSQQACLASTPCTLSGTKGKAVGEVGGERKDKMAAQNTDVRGNTSVLCFVLRVAHARSLCVSVELCGGVRHHCRSRRSPFFRDGDVECDKSASLPSKHPQPQGRHDTLCPPALLLRPWCSAGVGPELRSHHPAKKKELTERWRQSRLA